MSIKQKLLNGISVHPKLSPLAIGLAVTFAIGTAIGTLDQHSAFAISVNPGAPIRNIHIQIDAISTGKYTTLQPGQSGQNAVYCPQGTVATGGGFHIKDYKPIAIIDSNGGPAGWVVDAKNTTPEPADFLATVICAHLAS